MAAKQLGYDHHAYQTPVTFSGSTTAGANGVTTKFGAFTAMQLRAVAMAPNIASTSATQPVMFVKSGTATSTTTLSAVTSAAVTVLPNVLATAISLIQGDQVWVAHGTDATVSMSVGIELYPTPGAALACP
jgi:hypothetical protein